MDIDTMPAGREMDALIATDVLGLDVVWMTDPSGRWPISPFARLSQFSRFLSMHGQKVSGEDRDGNAVTAFGNWVEFYSTGESSALMLLDRFCIPQNQVWLEWKWGGPNAEQWVCTVEKGFTHDGDLMRYKGIGPTRALAISRMSLKSVGL